MQTRKHFQAVAEKFKHEIDRANDLISGGVAEAGRGWKDATQKLAHDMADIFAADNPRFDKSRFLAACGL